MPSTKRNPHAPKGKKVATFKDIKKGTEIIVHRGEHTEHIRITRKPYKRKQLIADPGQPKRVENFWWVEYHSVTWNSPHRTTLRALGICADEAGGWAKNTYATLHTEA